MCAGLHAPSPGARAGQALFDGEVTAVERSYQPDRGRVVRIRADDRLHRLRKNGGPRVHLDVSASRLANDLASGAGLNVDARRRAVAPRVVQTRQSDLELLLDVASAGLFIDVDGDVLRLITLEGTGTTVPLCSAGRSSRPTSRPTATRPPPRRGARLGRRPARDPRGTATSARTGRSVSAEVAPDAVGRQRRADLLDERASDDDIALGLAQATLDLGVATEVILRGVALGDRGCGQAARSTSADRPAIAGRYVLTEVRHTIDRARGYLSAISSAPPDPAPRPYATVVTVGEVGARTIRRAAASWSCCLPGDLETAWLEVVSVGAGSNKGLSRCPTRATACWSC